MDDWLPRRLMRAARMRPDALSRAATTIQQALRVALPGAGTEGLLGRLDLPGLRRTTPSEPATPAGAQFLSGEFTGSAGSRPYRLYTPTRPAARAPLLVMLHGCTQSAEDFAAGTRMNALAERVGALVLYPVQVAGANAQRCWNWFSPANQQAGHGEAAILAEMTRLIAAERGVDPKRIFAAGLSAGGAQAAILGAAYPDIFAAIGVHSGLACGAAHDTISAFAAMRQGHAGVGRIPVPAIVFHGDRDGTVNIANAAALAAQVGETAALRTEQGQVPGGLAWTRTVQPATGVSRLEQWVVHGLGHAWSGGDAAGSYTEPRGPDASGAMLRFFLDHRAAR